MFGAGDSGPFFSILPTMTPPFITSPAYTPAPWYVSESLKRGFNVRSARGGFLAWVGTGSERRDAANAQLMAAAPTLLDACKMLLAIVVRDCDEEVFGAELSHAEGVIADAEGRTRQVESQSAIAVAA